MSAGSSGNRHRLKQLAPRNPRRAFWGFLRGQLCKSVEKMAKRLDRLGPNCAHIMHMDLGMDTD